MQARMRVGSLAALLSVVLLTSCASHPVAGPIDSLTVERRAVLPLEVIESSGLSQHQGQLWTHNDSGDKPQLYRLDLMSGEVLSTLRVRDALNFDWEEMAYDADWLHVLDCGNNLGRREWMQIYSIRWQSLLQASAGNEVPSRLLEFRFADAGKSAGAYAHNNDCEAAAVVNGKVWVFSKNWQDQYTRVYQVDPAGASRQVVEPVGRYPVGGLITAADYDPQRQRLVLLGYTKGRISSRAFVWTVPVEDNLPDWEGAQYHSLTPAGQWEAVVWTQDGLLLTRESSLLGQAWLGTVSLP
jgi:hypothetical protein